ncbi:hypothetical protein [Paracoccus sulfuroxidans]|uniref:Uncharacterized protein n=1 Tax=Paracoccus sulfuroxidans TaxID=384678 RepID=A0A562NL53_9RHOB|nr:hypothetical protein [Paracoccus sulfuroxidans]TWI32853.1 hypothetical protein IQ24_02731 [Paracoccus sulfuroxidans]
MGFHVSLFLLKDGDAQAFLRAAGLRDGGYEDPENEAPFSMARFGGNSLIWMNWHDDMPSEREFARFSEAVPFINLDVAESAVMSVCRFWQDGKQVWVLAHDGAQETGSDFGGLDVAGDLPPEAQPIIEACLQIDRAADAPELHDAPILLFEALGGIRPDAVTDLKFQALLRDLPVATAPARKPWWRFWS